MRINVVKTLPKTIYIAFSGGVDSVVMAHVARQRGIDVALAFFDHGNEFAKIEKEFAIQYAIDNDYSILTAGCHEPISGSKEKFWRDSRYAWFKTLDGFVATGHNLDDAVEWYLMTALQGQGQYMTYDHSNVVRPLLTTAKKDIIAYARYHKLSWLEDPSNRDEAFTIRNKVRSKLVPIAVDISPGLYNIVKKRCHEKAHDFKKIDAKNI